MNRQGGPATVSASAWLQKQKGEQSALASAADWERDAIPQRFDVAQQP